MNQTRLEIPEHPRYALTVRCPRCSAPPGLYCFTPSGEYAAQIHRDRIRAANRKAIEELP